LILHRSAHPYLFMLVGQRVPVDDVSQILPAITKIRKQHQGEISQGRPEDKEAQKQYSEINQLDVSKKEKAYRATSGSSEKDFSTGYQRLRRNLQKNSKK
jgi:hypothetical protein